MMKDILIVGLGGFLGSSSRYLVHLMTIRHLPDKSFVATLIVNLTGCLLIGLLSGGLLKQGSQSSLLLITGLCGGFTTFSTFAMDGIKLMKAGMSMHFLAYAGISMIGGFMLCLLGLYLYQKA